jgi:hypothetical protein
MPDKVVTLLVKLTAFCREYSADNLPVYGYYGGKALKKG